MWKEAQSAAGLQRRFALCARPCTRPRNTVRRVLPAVRLFHGPCHVQVCTGVMIHGYEVAHTLCGGLQQFMQVGGRWRAFAWQGGDLAKGLGGCHQSIQAMLGLDELGWPVVIRACLYT